MIRVNQESHGEQRMQGNEGVIASENHGSNGENAGLSLHHVSKGRSVEKGEETDNVEKVQFLIEGEKIEETMGHLDYTKPFEGIDI